MPPPSRRSVSLRVPVQVAAQDAGAGAGRRRFSLVAYTGEAMNLTGFDLPVVIDCATLDARAQMIPALLDHMPFPDTVVGQIDSIGVAAGGLPPVTAGGYFTPTDDPEDLARMVMARADGGYVWQASVGGDPGSEERIEAGASGQANGRTYPGPCYILRGVVLREISFVVLGGDRFTSAIAARHRRTRLRATAMTFEEWLLSLGFADPAALDEIQSTNMRKLYDQEVAEGTIKAPAGATDPNNPPADPNAPPPAPPPPAPPAARGRPVPVQAARPDAEDEMNRRLAANQQRVDRIHEIAAEYPAVRVAANGRQVSLASHAILNKWTPEQTELYAMRAARPSPQAATAPGGSGGADELVPLIAETAVCLSAGLKADGLAKAMTSRRRPDGTTVPVTAAERERVMNVALSAEYRGYGLHSLMDATIRAAGRAYHGARKTNEFVRAALQADHMLRTGQPGTAVTASQGFSTISLSGTLGNVANKAMIQAYDAQMVTWREWVGVRSYGDFKVQTGYRLDMSGAFRKVGQDGELKHVGMTETGYTNKLDTHGAIIALTRQMQINDDLGAFLQIPAGLGRMAAVRVEEGCYVLLLSNTGSFFHANNGNLNSGPGSALSIDALTASETAFGNAVDSNGKPILTMADRILVPTNLRVTADVLYKQTTLVTNGDDLAYYDNPHAGKFRPVSSPYLNNTSIRDQDGAALSGQSSTAWYQFADPAARAAVVIGFLNGQETPTIEDAETDFATLGHQWRGYLDFGVGFEDPKAAQKNAGA